MGSGKGAGREGPRERKRGTERNVRGGRSRGEGHQEGREETRPTWVLALFTPSESAQGSLSCSSLPLPVSPDLEEFCFHPSPHSCHGDGNLDPVESSLCLAMRLQHPASCLPACAWAASYACSCGDPRAALLRGDPAPSPGCPGWGPWHGWHYGPSENIQFIPLCRWDIGPEK